MQDRPPRLQHGATHLAARISTNSKVSMVQCHPNKPGPPLCRARLACAVRVRSEADGRRMVGSFVATVHREMHVRQVQRG